MNNNSTGVAELFHLLESNKLSDVEEIKKVFHDHFLSTKDNWLVNGLFDYYLSTNSLRAIEVLAGVREPHDKHLLDRLCECFSRTAGNECHEKNEQRIHALTLLGHVARRQPTWLYKLANHQLFKELLKLLKQDTNTLSLMSALLLLVTLLPMLPAALGPHLNDIFDIFGRLSYYHCHQSLNFTSSSSTSTTSTTNNNNFSYNMDNNQLYLLHLQIGLNSLFHRLYAMYPCNFISYLKIQYLPRDQDPTFNHTIKPMLDSVRLHPLLVTASKDAEINATRWKKMEHHDVVAECGRFALDKSKEDNCFTITNDSRATPIQDHLISQNLSHNLIIGTDELSEASINGPDSNKNCHNNKNNNNNDSSSGVCVDNDNDDDDDDDNNSCNNNENSDGCDNNNHKVVVVDNNNNDDDEDTFWSPSMTVSPHSPPPPPTPPTPTPPPSPSLSPSPPPISLPPPPLSSSSSSSPPPAAAAPPSPSSILQIIPSLETSSTPNNNNNNNNNNKNKINSSPPEAAVEATPETTPVKDVRGQNTINTCLRQSPLVGSPAVRALSTFSNNLITSASSLTFSPHNLHNHLNNNSNNNLSRPSTPTTTTNNNNNNNSVGNLDTLVSDTSILSQKINRLFVDRQNFVQSRKLIFNSLENGGGVNNKMTNDSWNADQEISDIHHNLQNKNLLIPIAIDDDQARGARVDLTKKVRRLRFHSQCADSMTNVERSKSCPNINKVQDNNNNNSNNNINNNNNNNNGRLLNQEINNKKIGRKNNNNNLVESSTQTINILPYKHLLTYLLDQRNQEQQQQQQLIKQNSRSSPTAMLDRYIERCSFKISNTSFDEKNKIQSSSTIPPIPLAATTTTTTTESSLPTTEATTTTTTTTTTTAVDESNDETTPTTTTLNDDSNNSDYAANQQFQLMHMQLLFERQRREVHAERNRRLLGKLRDSRALEELNGALTHQLRQAVKDIDELKCEIEKCKKDGRLAEERYTEALNHWQLKCVDEEQKNKILKQHSDILELELKNERKKLIECGEKNKITEATLFDAANQLKHALKAANQSEELKKTLDNVQKKFLLLGEAQTKLQELNIGPISMTKQEAVQIQRAYNEELSNLRRQFDARTSLIDALKAHIVELENKEIQSELHLTEQQRHIQELKEKNESELDAVESKYRAQVEINLLLETTILKLHGELELIKNGSRRIITSGASGSGAGGGTTSIHLGSSVSPKSGSLASSSEGSLAFHSGIGIISDCPDSSGEISNLQAIIEPTSLSSLSNNQ